MSETDDAPATPIEDLATLRTRLAEAHEHDPGNAAVGGFVLTMFFALPLGLWWGTDAGLFGAAMAGLGWLLLLALGLLIVGAAMGDSKTHAAAGRTLAVGGLLAGVGWFLYYGETGWVLPAILAAAGPLGGLLAWRAEARKQARIEADPPLGLSAETVAACRALPESLTAPVAALLDGAIADVQALEKLAANGMLDAAGESVTALRGDVDRAVRTLARRALVADTMTRRDDTADAAVVIEGMRRIAEELDNLTDAALVAAASAEGTAASLAEHISNLRLTTAGQAEIEQAVSGA